MLVKRKGEWMLVSKSNPKKVLKKFGSEKPSDEAVAREEARVNYFKNKGKGRRSKLFNR